VTKKILLPLTCETRYTQIVIIEENSDARSGSSRIVLVDSRSRICRPRQLYT